MRMSVLLSLTALVVLPGCIVRTAASVVTAPVKAGAKAADWATTSQDEADRARGRKERRAEEKERKRQREACEDAGYHDCR